MLGAQRACSSWAVPSSRIDSTSGCTSYARFLDSGSSASRSRSSTSSTAMLPWEPSSEATSRARSRASRSESARMWTTPERRPCGSGPPRRSMSTSSPVTERTTSGPVTKIRPSGPRITTSVSAGPYAAPPAAGPSTTEICGILPEAWVITWKIRPTACSDSTPSASRAPPECHRPMIGTPVGHRPVVGVDDDPAAEVAHRAAHDGGVGAEGDHAGAVDGADRGEHAGVVVGGDQLEAALVEERGQPVHRVARVLLAGELRRLGRVAVRRVARSDDVSRRRRRRWRRRSRRSC